MELIQSLIYSVARGHVSLYESRIMTKIIEYAQVSLKGEQPKRFQKQIHHKDPNCHILLPVSYLLDEGNDHYNHVYEAARSLMKKSFEFYDFDKKEWHATPIIYNITIAARKGLLSFYVDRRLLEVVLNFQRGYKSYDLETALSLGNPAAVRLYIIMNEQSTPLSFSVDNLKQMFGVEDKYKQTADFIKKVIEPARIAIDKAGVNGFTYSRVFCGRKVVKLTFFPKQGSRALAAPKIESHDENVCYQALCLLLKRDAMFTAREVSCNSATLKRAVKIPDAVNNLSRIIHISHRKKDPKAYIVGSLKREIKALTP